MDAEADTTSMTVSQDSMDDELLRKGLPQISVPCAMIIISHKHVLKKAAKKLGILIHEFKFTDFGDEDVVASVRIDVPPLRGNPCTKTQEFYGQWSRFSTEAKESACLAALSYLKDSGLIVVNGTNYADLKKCKRKLEEEQFWSSVFYERAFALKEQLAAKGSFHVPPAQANTASSVPVDSLGLQTGLGRSPKEDSSSTPPPKSTPASTSMPKTQGETQATSRVRRPLFRME